MRVRPDLVKRLEVCADYISGMNESLAVQAALLEAALTIKRQADYIEKLQLQLRSAQVASGDLIQMSTVVSMGMRP